MTLHQIRNNEHRKKYYFKVVLICFLYCAYFFALANLVMARIIPGLYNLGFGILFTAIYFFRNRNFDNTLTITAIFYQIFFFGHSFFLLPGKQLEGALGVLTCLLPIFVTGFRLWFFFITNFILFHIVLFNVGYGDIFYFQYLYYMVLFIIFYTILNENRLYEKELLIQQDKIQQDAKQLKELDELKTHFFTNISHELRTPLTLLLSPIKSLLNSSEFSSKNRMYLNLMERNGQKLRKRINELLELSRLGAKKVALNLTPINIDQLCQQIIALHEGTAHLREVQLTYENELASEIHLSLDAAKIEMILTNFLSNALKFTPKKGQIQLKIYQQKEQLLIRIQDTGIGIPSDNLNRIFERFHQVKQTTYYEGTGIGLALCHELAILHQGKVWAESILGQGSTFYLQLPYVETQIEVAQTVQQVEINPPKEIALSPTKNAKAAKILIVEDNVDLRQYMDLLLSEKYQVTTVENGQAALELLEKTEQQALPNLIITDLMMPVMNGQELLQQIKSSDSLRSIPVIVLTAQQAIDVKIDLLRIGIDDYLTKPFVEKELLARIANLIQNSQQRIGSKPTPTTEKTSPTKNQLSESDLQWLQMVEEKLLTQIGNTNFKLSDLANELFMTTRTLQLRIKNLTGQTPKQYQRNIQLHEARKILKSGKVQTVSELSYQLGFEDQHYLSGLYKKQFGVTPKEELARL